MKMLTSAQAETWSRQPDSAKAQRTHEAIRAVLRGGRSKIRDRDFTDFLQGSYRSDTNIRGDSDVDIVARLNETFRHETSLLGPFWAEQQKARFSPPTYSFEQFRVDTFETLHDAFGDAVTLRNKCIEVAGRDGRLNADVVTCLEYRRYREFERYDSGITFRPLHEDRWIVNFPVQHYENGIAKQGSTHQRFKPMVRLMKNARNAQVDARRLADNVAPSYFLQCLIYNVPDHWFVPNLVQTYYAVLKHLEGALNDPLSFISENGIVPLFGNTPEQWNVANARSTVAALWAI